MLSATADLSKIHSGAVVSKQVGVRTQQVRRNDRELAGDVRDDAPGGLAGARVQADLLHAAPQRPDIVEVHLRITGFRVPGIS